MPKPSFESILPDAPGELVAIDLYGPLPRSVGGVTYLVALDVFSKLVSLYPLKRATTVAIIHRFEKQYFPEIGKPKRMLSDQGTQFTAKAWATFLVKHEVKQIMCSVRHPQGNPSERVMRELGRLFRSYCSAQQIAWARSVLIFPELINNAVHESTGFAPVELQFGRRPKTLWPFLDELYPEQKDAHIKIFLARETLFKKGKKRRDKIPGSIFRPFEVGDLVLLKANPISAAYYNETKKFMLLFEGPYRIKEKKATKSYVLEDPVLKSERGVFHASHYKLFVLKKITACELLRRGAGEAKNTLLN